MTHCGKCNYKSTRCPLCNYGEMHGKINKEVLEDKIKNIPQETGSFKKDIESVLKIPVEQWNNSMLKTIIKKIYINNDGTINIQWIIEG